MGYFFIALTVVIVCIVIYKAPISHKSIDDFYNGDLQEISEYHRVANLDEKKVVHNGYEWEYISTQGADQTVLFLPGAGGKWDIWWHQIEYFRNDYNIISVTYPEIKKCDELIKGLTYIMSTENVDHVHVIGSSFGGALAQKFAAKNPELTLSVVLGNTAVPRKESYPSTTLVKVINLLLNIIPMRGLTYLFRKKFANTDESKLSNQEKILVAYLLAYSCGGVNKKSFVSRFICAMEYFEDRISPDIPLLILDSENDQNISVEQQDYNKNVYPNALAYFFKGTGHFPYITSYTEYNEIVKKFIVTATE